MYSPSTQPTVYHAAAGNAALCIQAGEAIESLSDMVSPERFKKVLRHYHDKANREPNAFVIGIAKTLIQVAQYHAGVTFKEIGELKRLASKLPAIPFALTPKNKALLRHFACPCSPLPRRSNRNAICGALHRVNFGLGLHANTLTYSRPSANALVHFHRSLC
jgi:hypothetical protein